KKANEKHLNYDDSQRLLNALRSKLGDGLGYYLLLLGLVSGLRFGELVGLTRKDFDFVNNKINVEKTWSYMGNQVGFGATKNDESDRKSTRLNSSHVSISYAVFCLKKKNIK